MKRFIELEEEIMKNLLGLYNENTNKPIEDFKELYTMEEFIEKSPNHLETMKEIESYVREVRIFSETVCDQEEDDKVRMFEELKEIREKVEEIGVEKETREIWLKKEHSIIFIIGCSFCTHKERI